MEVTSSVDPARKWSKKNQAIYEPDGQNVQLVGAFENTAPERSCCREWKEISQKYASLILLIIVLLLAAVGIGIYFGIKQSGKYLDTKHIKLKGIPARNKSYS